jgi:hypothetical protein
VIDLTLIIDVESSALLRKDLPDDHESQPHLASIAGKLVTPDWDCVSQFYSLIRPDNWTLDPGAAAVNGLNEKLLADAGLPEWFALAELKQRALLAGRIVGHNVRGFDFKIIEIALNRCGSDSLWWKKMAIRLYDTMSESAPILEIPGNYGDWKWPSLEEAVRFFSNTADGRTDPETWPYGPDWTSDHQAYADVDACEYVFRHLQEMRDGTARD